MPMQFMFGRPPSPEELEVLRRPSVIAERGDAFDQFAPSDRFISPWVPTPTRF
jgi:hypothetical protein